MSFNMKSGRDASEEREQRCRAALRAALLAQAELERQRSQQRAREAGLRLGRVVVARR